MLIFPGVGSVQYMFSSNNLPVVFPPYGSGTKEFACAVNAETLAEMVGTAATWLSSAVSSCVLAFQKPRGF